MRIVITGGAGFLGRRLARAILARGHLTDAAGGVHPVSELVLLDVVAAPDLGDPRVHAIAGDLADPAVIDSVVTRDTSSIFHLAAVVSGEAEADFDKGMRVNLDASRLLLERCRRLDAPPRFVFASSLAVYGGPLPDPVPDDAPLTPQASYGAQKVMTEYLTYDMTRKGFVDAICPVAPTTKVWVTSPNTVIRNFIVGHEAPATAFAHTRSINVPGMAVTVTGMVDALRRVAGDAVADRVKWQYDDAIDRIVATWPTNFAPRLAPALGMTADTDFEAIIRAYIAEDMPKT